MAKLEESLNPDKFLPNVEDIPLGGEMDEMFKHFKDMQDDENKKFTDQMEKKLDAKYGKHTRLTPEQKQEIEEQVKRESEVKTDSPTADDTPTGSKVEEQESVDEKSKETKPLADKYGNKVSFVIVGIWYSGLICNMLLG